MRAPERLTQRFTGPNRHIFTLEITARAQDICEPVTMVATLERSGCREMFVTTLKSTPETELSLIVELADFEIARGRADSPSSLRSASCRHARIYRPAAAGATATGATSPALPKPPPSCALSRG